MKTKITRKEAHNILYSLWENGEVPSNFTEDHSYYQNAINFIIKYGYFDYNEFLEY